MNLDDPKRTTSAFDFCAEGRIYVEPSNFVHNTYSEHRLEDPIHAKEKVFYEEWKKIASNNLACLLTEEINKDDYEGLSQRDIEVAATLMQWLGSNCGQSFLRETQAKADAAIATQNQLPDTLAMIEEEIWWKV